MSVWDKERKKTTLLPRLQWGAQPLYELIRGCQYELTCRANLLSGVFLVPLFLSFSFFSVFPFARPLTFRVPITSQRKLDGGTTLITGLVRTDFLEHGTLPQFQ